jgi:stage V sporulation protein S
VAKDTNVKNLAGSIAWISRDGECPEMICSNSLAVNQAVKAMAISRTYLQADKVDYHCYPIFTQEKRRQGKGKGAGFTLYLKKTAHRVKTNAPPPLEEPEELRIGKDSNSGKVAGAIAERVRQGIRVQLTGVGPDAVCNAVTAIAIARKYLSEDGVDIAFQAAFNKLESDDGRSINCIELRLLAEQY